MNYNAKVILLCLSMNFLFINVSLAQETQNEIMSEDLKNREERYTLVADNYLKFLTEKNLEGILSLYSETASVEDPVGGEIIQGKNKLHQFYSGAVKMDLQLKRIGSVRVAGSEVAFPFQLIMEVDGIETVTDIIDVFKFDENGKIQSMRAFWGPGNRKLVEE